MEHEEVEGMANARLLHKKISRSEQVNDLSDRAALLYTWGIPHTDDFGRMDGRPRIVRATIVPLKEWTDAEVELYLYEMRDRGLIHYYEASGIRIVQYTGFEQNQSGLHKRTRSNYPDPPDVCADIPGSSGKATGSSSEFPPESESETETEVIPVRSSKRTSVDYSSEFEEFWRVYPRTKRMSKKEAYRCWNARLRGGVTADRLTRCANNYAAECQQKGKDEQYIMQPPTFLGPNEKWMPYEEPVAAVATDFHSASSAPAYGTTGLSLIDELERLSAKG